MAEIVSGPSDTKSCSRCGSNASGNFCPNCGNDLGASRRKNGLRTIIGLSFVAALLYVTFAGIPSFNLFGSSLDLSIDVPGKGDPYYGFVMIMNLADKPIELREVRINRRTDDACDDKKLRKLATGERAMVATGGSLLGLCGGSIVRVTVITDQGEGDYTINR
jgi:hypothetical protein